MSSEFLDKFHHLLLLILRFKSCNLDFSLFILFLPIMKIYFHRYKYQEMKNLTNSKEDKKHQMSVMKLLLILSKKVNTYLLNE